jgi:hypothetical protein
MFDPPNEIFIEEAEMLLTRRVLNELWESCKDNILGAQSIERQWMKIENFLNYSKKKYKKKYTLKQHIV